MVKEAKKVVRLNRKAIDALDEGTHKVDKITNLYAKKRGSGGGFIYRYMKDGRSKDIQLAPLNSKLDEIRVLAENMNGLQRSGRNPREALQVDETSRTVAIALKDFLDTHEAGWRGEKTRKHWENMFSRHAAPILQKSIASVKRDDILEILKPVWIEKQETGRKMLTRLQNLFDNEVARGNLDANPAEARLVQKLLPKQHKKSIPHPALNWQDAPDYWEQLSQRHTITSYCLRLITLSSCRSGEARKAEWEHIDFDENVWNIPETKQNTAHKVPLTKNIEEVLDALRSIRHSPYLFPSPRNPEVPISDMSVLKEHRKIDPNTDVHGLRATFKTFALNNGHSDEISELCLGHQVGSRVRRAYVRTELLDERRELLEHWQKFLARAN